MANPIPAPSAEDKRLGWHTAGYDLVKNISDRSYAKEWPVGMEEVQVVIGELIKMGYLDCAS